jgi:hypothetical protein
LADISLNVEKRAVLEQLQAWASNIASEFGLTS